jgi:Uma2 family endonuclease
MSAIPQYTPETRKYSVAEYFELESQLTENLYEFRHGEIISRAGGTDTHNEISLNVAYLLRALSKKRGGKCKTYMNDVKLEVLRYKKYYYPDVFVTCSETDAISSTLKKEPTIVVEVLSNSTEQIDYHEKQLDYLAIPSLQYYMLVSQKKPTVEVYQRKNDFFSYKIYSQLDESIDLGEFGNLSLKDIFEGIDFPKEENEVIS